MRNLPPYSYNSGATHCCVDCTFATGLKQQATHTIVRLADGTGQPLSFRTKLDIKIQGHKQSVTCYIIDFDIVLGDTWFHQNAANFDYPTRTCTIHTRGVKHILYTFFFFWWGLLHGPQQGPDRMKEKNYKTGKRKTPA